MCVFSSPVSPVSPEDQKGKCNVEDFSGISCKTYRLSSTSVEYADVCSVCLSLTMRPPHRRRRRRHVLGNLTVYHTYIMNTLTCAYRCLVFNRLIDRQLGVYIFHDCTFERKFFVSIAYTRVRYM